MIAPYARYFIDERLGRMRIHHDIENRKIRIHIGHGQRRIGERDKSETRPRRHPPDAHQSGITCQTAPERHRHLHESKRQSEDQRIMSEFDGHGVAPSFWPFQTPCLRSASATSLGM